jgi:predicted enzyme related to lactoylglutathione lyase
MTDNESKFRGLRTVIYGVSDIASAKAWYSKAFGVDPYFDEPFYVGFSIGGYELGLLPGSPSGPGGTTAYWGVADIESSVEYMQSIGATVAAPPKDVGEGIKVASVIDPDGNHIGIIENPYFDPKATS